MDLRLANINDLSKLKAVYGNIIDNMNRNNIPIWDEIYPCEFFSDDIENNRLYLLVEEHDDIVAAFALCESNAGESYVKWASRASMHVLKIVECLREMVGKMVYINDNSNVFPLVRLKGIEQMPREEDEIIYLLKDYFLECIRTINEKGLDADDLEDSFLDKYMSDKAVFARTLRGRYPILEVYKMTESNEFLYAVPQDYNYATWEAINRGQGDSPEGSGGQKLAVSTFVMMMLMNYKKRMFTGESPWTVLIMDNPFGHASSGHVLDPIFKIAYKLNFQLIAFASPEIIKSEISERFPVFWALKIADTDEDVRKGTVTGKVVHGGRVIRH